MPRSSRLVSERTLTAFELVVGADETRPFLSDENKIQGGRGSSRITNKSNRSNSVKYANQRYSSLSSATRYAPPVMMKLISQIRGAGGISDLMHYLNKKETVEIEYHDGSAYLDAVSVENFASHWEDSLTKNATTGRAANENTKLLKHGIIVLPVNTEPAVALDIARTALSRTLGEKGVSYAIAGHFTEEGQNPHVHFAGTFELPNGRRFHYDKEFVFDLREAIADSAFERGIFLHQGMAYEREVKAKGHSKIMEQRGEVRSSVELTDADRQKLKPKLDDLKEVIRGATNRSPGTDTRVEQHLRSIQRSEAEREAQRKNLEQSLGHNPEIGR